MRTRVGLIFGGKSVEHEISVITALQTAAALDREKYDVVPLYFTKDNELYTGEALLEIGGFRDLPTLLAGCQRVMLRRENGRVQILRYPFKLFSQPVLGELDLAFPVAHGTNMEDGGLQGFLQMYGLPYVGSDGIASAGGMDKWASKCLLQGAGLPVLPGYCFQTASYFREPERIIGQLEELFGYPLIVKPVNLGSSVGISRGEDEAGLRRGIELASSFAQRILVEPALTHYQEINCAVLGDCERTETSACEEPLSVGDMLTYQDKYQGGVNRVYAKTGLPGDRLGRQESYQEGDQDGGEIGQARLSGLSGRSGQASLAGPAGNKGMSGASRRLPADIPASTEERIRDLAQKAFLALNCVGVVRVDFLVNLENMEVYINELNTIPGALSFYLWEAAGKSFRQLTEDLIALALKRQRRQERLIWSHDVNILAGMGSGVKGAKG
jgi:D-alanine-D-alanine ligase